MNTFRRALHILLAAALMLCLASCSGRQSTSPGDQLAAPPIEVPVSQSHTSRPDTAPATPQIQPAEPEVSTRICTPSLVVDNTGHLEGHPGAIQEGTVLNYAVPTDVPSYLPWNASTDTWLICNIYESLLMAHMNDIEDLRGCIAQSWSHSEDYMSWTFVIRRGVLFTDGTVCNADAIARSWDIQRTISPVNFTNYNISSWKATGEYEFTVYMAAPCAYFEVAMAGSSLVIVSPSALELYGTNDNRAAVGTAPYYVSSYTSGVGFVLSANTDYYLESKMPAIQTVNFHILSDETTILLALVSADIDGANLSNVESCANLVDSGFDGSIISALSDTAPLWFNARKVEAFRTLEVRKAICRFVDFDAINYLLYNGMGDAPSSLWATGSTGYVHSDEFYYDPAEGHELLADAGISPHSISFNSTIFEGGKSVFLAIQNELGKQGIHMEVEAVDPNANYTYLQNGDWTITIGCVGYRSATPYLPWTFVLRPDATIKQVWSDIYDPELYQKMMDEYDMMSTAQTWDEMLEHCRMITTYLQDDFGAIPGLQSPDFLVMSSRLKNAVYYTESHALMCWFLYV